MPTLPQLPLAVLAKPTDLIPLDSDGTTYAVSVGALLASTQAHMTLASGFMLGRLGIGAGGPEPIALGYGMTIDEGQLACDFTIMAELESPAFKGAPTAPTPPVEDSSDAIATTAFVQRAAGNSTVQPASAAILGGIKIGAGLAVQPDGTTAIAATLPGVDASALTVRSTIAGASPRTLAEIRGEYIHVADFLGGPPIGQDATAAMRSALTIAAARPGSTVVLCEGQWNFASLTGPFAVPSGTTIKGAGANQTQITWNDTATTNLFGSAGTSSTPATDIHFEDFTISGSWATLGASSGGGPFPVCMWWVQGLTFRNICVQYSRLMGIAARCCIDVIAENCTVRYCARDGISFAQCANITVSGCTIEHCDDDGITAHANVADPWLVRRNVVISNNRLFDCQGIKVLAGRNFSITGNIIDCCRAQGITVSTVAADNLSIEGETALQVGSITGNIITNVINRLNIDNINQNNPGISISGASARAGSLAAIPGEASTAAAAVIDPYPYFDVNSNSTTTAVPGSFGLVIAGNMIARTLPSCNGQATNPRTSQPYASWTDFGFGQMFTRTGWRSPTLAESDLQGDAISISGGVLRDVLITGNVIRGMRSGLAITNGVRFENIMFRGNAVVDCLAWGVIINTNAMLRCYIEDNLIDLDPFLKHPNRGAHGTWVALGEPTGIKAQAGSGVFVRRNVFRNVCRDSDQSSDAVAAGWLFDGNVIEADPAGTGFNAASKGVGYLRPSGGTLLCQVDSDPGSATFGQVLTAPTASSNMQPASGKWLTGHFIRNGSPAIAGGVVNLGWVRLSIGSNNNAGTDWAQALAVAGPVGTSLVLAGPTSASAVPTFRQLGATEITGLATVARSGSYADLVNVPAMAISTVSNTYAASGAIAPTDNFALVSAASAVSMTLAAGAADGHVVTIKRFGAGAVTLTATIDGAAGTQIVMNSASLKEATTLVWNAAHATWLLI